MDDLSTLILFENENMRLDFKRDQYSKEKFPFLLKDIMSMANAFTKEDRYIIIGLKPKSRGDRGLKGIDGNLTDPATLQQLVYENIEPELEIEYYPFIYENLVFGVLKISNCNNPPYLMKKDYVTDSLKLFKGEGYIRKGSHQTRLTRTDFDHYLQSKIQDNYFLEEVEFSFITDSSLNVIELIDLYAIKMPSVIEREEIEKVLELKKNEQQQTDRIEFPKHNIFQFNDPLKSLKYSPFGWIPYEDRDVPTLEKDLENVKNTFLDEDNYELFERPSNKCNITILNKGNRYIEDATLLVKIPQIAGLLVLEKVYDDPSENKLIVNIQLSKLKYPKVKKENDFYMIESHIGDIKHQFITNAFDEHLRILATTDLKTDSFKITCELYAKNIKTLIYQEIKIGTRKRIF